MENENKNLQGAAEETELQEKVRKDVSEKIAEAAAELQDEIDDAAEAVTEETVWEEEEEEILVKEPKTVSVKLSSLILSLVGTAIVGALVLFLGFQIPKWVEGASMSPTSSVGVGGSTIASVDGIKIGEDDMKYYLYISAMQYFQENTEDPTQEISDFDWDKEVKDGKTAEDIVKENALKTAIDEALLRSVGDKNEIEFDAKKTAQKTKLNTELIVLEQGKELAEAQLQSMAIESLNQYVRKVVQMEYSQTVKEEIQENSEQYYPQDRSVLEKYVSDDGASFKHILIAKETGEDANNEEAKAEEIASRIQNGESFEELLEEFGEDTNQPEEGYNFDVTSTQMTEVENAALALGVNEVSQVIESDGGYHIIKRVVGALELEKYWESEAKIKKNMKKLEKMSLVDLLKETEEAAERVEELQEELEKK